MYRIPFNRPTLTGNELHYIKQALEAGHISGDGIFSQKCSEFLEKQFGCKKALLTPSCTDAMEIASILMDLKEGDEVILPSFAFVTTANAFHLRGARPVFVDIRNDTLNLDEKQIESEITDRTKAIIALHYAGVACSMNEISAIAATHRLTVVEDAAQAMNSRYKGRYLGTIGDLGAYSFHETKNYTCGEGGALLLNQEQQIPRAEIIRQKGTNRAEFFRGQADKYTWRDLGSSFVLSDLLAAFLYAQLECLDAIQQKRKWIFETYYQHLSDLQEEGRVRLPVIPSDCQPNFHMFYILFNSEKIRNLVMEELRKNGILAVFHYLPLHTSPMGLKLGYKQGQFPITEQVSERLLRLPLFNTLTEREIVEVTDRIRKILKS